MSITIVGLGPGDSHLLTREAWELLSTATAVYLRTAKHPAVADLPPTVKRISFDHIYDTADSFADVYQSIVAQLIQLGCEDDIIYAVPGHPFMGEATVTALMMATKEAGISVTVVAGLSFVEPVLAAVGVDGLDSLQLYDALEVVGYHYPPFSPDTPLLLGQVYNRLLASELKLILMVVYPDEHPVFLIHAAGTNAEIVESIPLYAIDRSEHISYMTSLYIPPLPLKSALNALAESVATLRGPHGCPWDQEQTPKSMRSGFLEEVSELLDALDTNDVQNICEELGDVLFHLVMQAQMAAETETFKLTDVVAGIEAKIRRRHPHVWGDWDVSDSTQVVFNWEMLKRQEKGEQTPKSVLDNVPKALPALARSQKIQNRVRKVGFDWPNIEGVFAKLDEEILELKTATSPLEITSELGDVLFVVANLAHWLGVDAETALREANVRFSQRFHIVEQLANDRALDLKALDFAALDRLWEEAKENLAKIE